jgi:hypothetical protein
VEWRAAEGISRVGVGASLQQSSYQTSLPEVRPGVAGQMQRSAAASVESIVHAPLLLRLLGLLLSLLLLSLCKLSFL